MHGRKNIKLKKRWCLCLPLGLETCYVNEETRVLKIEIRNVGLCKHQSANGSFSSFLRNLCSWQPTTRQIQCCDTENIQRRYSNVFIRKKHVCVSAAAAHVRSPYSFPCSNSGLWRRATGRQVGRSFPIISVGTALHSALRWKETDFSLT